MAKKKKSTTAAKKAHKSRPKKAAAPKQHLVAAQDKTASKSSHKKPAHPKAVKPAVAPVKKHVTRRSHIKALAVITAAVVAMTAVGAWQATNPKVSHIEPKVAITAPRPKPASQTKKVVAASIVPTVDTATTLAGPKYGCEQGDLMNIVAHEDDDLLFMNPDIQHAIDKGMCVTTVYLTAGDDGGGVAYWRQREAAVEAAYSQMFDQPDEWQMSQAMVDNHAVAVARMPGTQLATLVFLRLPDGNLRGQGFAANRNESLASLRSGDISQIHSIDGAAAYTAQALTDSLTTMLNVFAPSAVNTQNFNSNIYDGDHSDHHAAGYFAAQAFLKYPATSVLKAYAGYTIRAFAVNVTGDDYDRKQNIFLTYASQDAAACSTVEICVQESGYGGYLERQYSFIVDQRTYRALLNQ